MISENDIPRLLDTNVFSYMLKGGETATLYLPDIKGKLVALSFASVGEVYRWAFSNHWGIKRLQGLEKALQNFIILDANKEVAQEWARIKSIPGANISDNDAWIVACAFIYGCVLVTHDKDLLGLPGLKIISHLSDST